jgi:hypothetical protein
MLVTALAFESEIQTGLSDEEKKNKARNLGTRSFTGTSIVYAVTHLIDVDLPVVHEVEDSQHIRETDPSQTLS